MVFHGFVEHPSLTSIAQQSVIKIISVTFKSLDLKLELSMRFCSTNWPQVLCLESLVTLVGLLNIQV